MIEIEVDKVFTAPAQEALRDGPVAVAQLFGSQVGCEKCAGPVQLIPPLDQLLDHPEPVGVAFRVNIVNEDNSRPGQCRKDFGMPVLVLLQFVKQIREAQIKHIGGQG